MTSNSEIIEKAIEHFSSLPSIGKKTAQRLIFHLLKKEPEFIDSFINSLVNLKDKVKFCKKCFNYSDSDTCFICSSSKRKNNIICVVEEPVDVNVIEKTNEYFGLYHVLHGILNPLDGITPDMLKIKELLMRLTEVDEVIIALNQNVEGEVTTQYLTRLIKPLNIKVSRLASGIPMGSQLEFTDSATLSRAISSRIEL